MNFADFTQLVEKYSVNKLIKAFRAEKIVVKMVDYDLLATRTTDQQELESVLSKFDVAYKLEPAKGDNGLLYIRLLN